jgi:hypothetical protein
LRCANVTAIFKKYSPSNYKKYRPISLISVIGKVMGGCVYKHIHNYLLENNIITNNQSGFTKGDYFDPNPKETLLYQLTIISLVNPDAKPYQMPY